MPRRTATVARTQQHHFGVDLEVRRHEWRERHQRTDGGEQQRSGQAHPPGDRRDDDHRDDERESG